MSEIDSEGRSKLNNFNFEGQIIPVNFVESMEVKPGVNCDIYEFTGDTEKDLAVVRIDPGSRTPLQRVLQGERTVEGYISGKGEFVVTGVNGERQTFKVGESTEPFFRQVSVGEIMQWRADYDSELVFSEVCFPPYKEGRFENLLD